MKYSHRHRGPGREIHDGGARRGSKVSYIWEEATATHFGLEPDGGSERAQAKIGRCSRWIPRNEVIPGGRAAREELR